MKVVLDTNVIVAAFAARGLCAEVFEVCVLSHTIVLSGHTLRETEKALLNKVRLPKQMARDIIDYLMDWAEVAEPEVIDPSACRDKDDLLVLGTATRAGSEVIITGDADLLSIKSYRGIDIITPREFWDRLR